MFSSLRATLLRIWRAWTQALPFHLFFSGLIVFAFAWQTPPQEASSHITPQAVQMVLVALIGAMGMWAYAGQSVRADFTPKLGLIRAPSLLWRAFLVALLGIIGFGSPWTQSAITGPQQAGQIGIGFTVAVGLMSAAAFVLLAWVGQIGDAPPAPEERRAESMAGLKLAGRAWRADINRLWRLIRHVWRRLPAALFGLVATLSVVSFALHLIGFVLSPLTGGAPLLVLFLTLPVFALCPTTAAVLMGPMPPLQDSAAGPKPQP